MNLINRRHLLLATSLVSITACANRSLSFNKPTEDELLVQEFINREKAIIDLYFAGINQERSFRTQLTKLRDNHLVHLTLWTKEISASPNPSPTGLQVASVKQLILAEEDHLKLYLDSITKTDDVLILQNIGQIASSVTQNIYWLNKLITPAKLPEDANFQGSEVGEN